MTDNCCDHGLRKNVVLPRCSSGIGEGDMVNKTFAEFYYEGDDQMGFYVRMRKRARVRLRQLSVYDDDLADEYLNDAIVYYERDYKKNNPKGYRALVKNEARYFNAVIRKAINLRKDELKRPKVETSPLDTVLGHTGDLSETEALEYSLALHGVVDEIIQSENARSNVEAEYDEWDAIDAGLSVMTDDEREAVTLYYLNGWEVPRIAQYQGKSEAAVYKAIYRGVYKAKSLRDR